MKENNRNEGQELRSEVLRTVAALEAALTQWAALMQRPSEARLGPPATLEAVEGLAVRVGRPLPPSYRAFLLLHDGWLRFYGGSKLLSVADQTSEWVAGRTPRGLASTALVVQLGVHEAVVVYIDLVSASADGESIVVQMDVDDGEIVTHPSFLAFLQSELTVVKLIVTTLSDGLLGGGV